MEKVEKIVNAVKKATARESYSIQLQKEKHYYLIVNLEEFRIGIYLKDIQ